MQRVLSIGHRGAAGHAPENTLGAIHKGIALGVDFIEIDVRRTADGALVILHDETVNRTTNGKGRVDRLSLREIQTFSAGNGEIIPTLEDALKAVAGRAGLL
ncbi:MAG: glycerophosphodiester phosphodiesterase family protein, partial [Nitrospirota bacterium]